MKRIFCILLLLALLVMPLCMAACDTPAGTLDGSQWVPDDADTPSDGTGEGEEPSDGLGTGDVVELPYRPIP